MPYLLSILLYLLISYPVAAMETNSFVPEVWADAEKKSLIKTLNNKKIILKLLHELYIMQRMMQPKTIDSIRIQQYYDSIFNKLNTVRLQSPKTATKSQLRSALNSLKNENSIQKSTAFHTLKGLLPLPIHGEPLSTDCQISCWLTVPSYTAVHAVYDGTVVFAKALAGYKQLVIIDHANDYMTIYGNNDNVLVNVDDQIKADDIIGFAGKKRTESSTKIYFDIRYQRASQSAAAWFYPQ